MVDQRKVIIAEPAPWSEEAAEFFAPVAQPDFTLEEQARAVMTGRQTMFRVSHGDETAGFLTCWIDRRELVICGAAAEAAPGRLLCGHVLAGLEGNARGAGLDSVRIHVANAKLERVLPRYGYRASETVFRKPICA